MYGRESVNRPIEGCDRRYTARLRARDEVGPGEIDSLDFVYLERAEEQRLIDNDNRWKADDRAHELRDSLPLNVVEGLEYVDDLRDDQIG